MKAKLIRDNGTNRIYQISTGENICLYLDEDQLSIKVINSNDNEIGLMEFTTIESDYDIQYKLKWMYLDKLGNLYKRQGLGRACIEYFNDYFGVIVTAAENDGETQDDGSHLTQDAPGFVEQLRQEGLIL